MISDDDQAGFFASLGRQSQITHPSRYHHPNVSVGQSVYTAGFAYPVAQSPTRPGQVEKYGFGGVFQPFQVLLQLENTTLVEADALKNSIPVQKAMVKDRNLCLFGIHKIAV